MARLLRPSKAETLKLSGGLDVSVRTLQELYRKVLQIGGRLSSLRVWLRYEPVSEMQSFIYFSCIGY